MNDSLMVCYEPENKSKYMVLWIKEDEAFQLELNEDPAAMIKDLKSKGIENDEIMDHLVIFYQIGENGFYMIPGDLDELLEDEEGSSGEDFNQQYLDLTREMLMNLDRIKNVSHNGEHHYGKGGSPVQLELRSILRSQASAALAYRNLKAAMGSMRKKLILEGKIEVIRAAEMVYMNHETHEAAAKALQCHKVTLQNWLNRYLEDLSILMFGIDALKKFAI